jgi:probable HAF family extracellular repeat protein
MPRPRRTRFLALFAVLALGTIALTAWLSRPAPPRYSVTDLGVLPGDTDSDALAINSAGDVVGLSSAAGGTSGAPAVFHVFLYRSGRMARLGTLPGSKVPMGMNTQGEVTGYASLPAALRASPYGRGKRPGLALPARATAAHHAFLYSRGKMQDLGTLPGSTDSMGEGINDRGEIAGAATGYTPIYTPSGVPRGHAFVYSHGRMMDLGVPPGCVQSEAWGISATGQVVGRCLLTSGLERPFLYDSRTRKMTLLAVPAPYTHGDACQVNDKGEIIGRVSTADCTQHAALWRGGRMIDLKEPPGEANGGGAGINNQGEAVGSCGVKNGPAGAFLLFLRKHAPNVSALQSYPPTPAHAFVYRGGKMQDLNDLIPAKAGWVLTDARGINDRGQIVGNGERNGQERAFLLTPLR